MINNKDNIKKKFITIEKVLFFIPIITYIVLVLTFCTLDTKSGYCGFPAAYLTFWTAITCYSLMIFLFLIKIISKIIK
jgi:hypothetical protein